MTVQLCGYPKSSKGHLDTKGESDLVTPENDLVVDLNLDPKEANPYCGPDSTASS